MSKKCIYTPAAIKKDFYLRIYCELKNLSYICYIDNLIILTNTYLSMSLLYHIFMNFSTDLAFLCFLRCNF